MTSRMWTFVDSMLDEETNMCHAMAVKITGNDDIEIIFSGSSGGSLYEEEEEEVCSVDSYSGEPSTHFVDSYSEPSNSLLLEEEIEERRRAKQQSMLSTSMSTATTETNSTRTRTMSNNITTNASQKSCFVDLDEFQQEQDQRDRERRQRRQRRKLSSGGEQENEEHDCSNQGPLQRKQSEETEDSDIDDSLVFDDDFVAEFDNEGEQSEDVSLVYDDDEDLVMVDDDDIDDDEALTRLIDIHVGDMMDGSSHMEKISMRLRPTFDLPSAMPTPSTNVMEVPPNAVSPMIQNYSRSSRRQLILPQIVEQEVEDDQEGSKRQAFIDEIEDPRLRALLKTIHRRSKCSERFDMDALLESLRKENAEDPTIHSALENLSSRMNRKATDYKNSKPSKNASEIEEIDLDLFFDDIRKGVQQESRQDGVTKVSPMAENRENASSAELQRKISDEVVIDELVLEHGMSSLTMGHRTCISSTTMEESVLVALNTNLGSTNENKPSQPSNFFSRNKNSKQKTPAKKNDTTKKESTTEPFSTLNNKTSLGSRFKLKKKLTQGGNKMSKTVGKLLSKTPTIYNSEYASDTPTSVTLASIGSSSDGIIPAPPSGAEEDQLVGEMTISKSRMAKLWQKTSIIGRGRGDSYQTLDPVGRRAFG